MTHEPATPIPQSINRPIPLVFPPTGQCIDPATTASSGSTKDTARPHLDQFANWIRLQVSDGQIEQNILSRSTICLCDLTAAMWSGVAEREATGSLKFRTEHNGLQSQKLAINPASVLPTFQQALTENRTVVSKLGPLTVIAAPFPQMNCELGDVTQPNRQGAALAIGLALDLGPAPVEPFLLTVQLAAAELSRAVQRDPLQVLQWQSRASAAIAELLSELSLATNEQHACRIVTAELNKFLNCEQVVIGWLRGRKKSVRIMASSGQSRIDQGAQATRAWREVLQESCFRLSQIQAPLTCSSLPEEDGAEQLMTIAHRQCLQDFNAKHPASNSRRSILSIPLVTPGGDRLGAVGCIISSSLSIASATDSNDLHLAKRFLTAASPYVANTLQMCRRAGQGVFARALRATAKSLAGNRWWIALATVAACTALLACPVRYRLNATALLTPGQRNFAVAPYDGILESCLVKPGDVVRAGQVLAQLDRVELEMRRADLVAQRQQAIKKRDVYRSTADLSNMQIAACEERQLQAQLELIEHRLEHLAIVADASGVVLQSPMKDARNAPIKLGNILIEFATLSKLKIELEIREAEHPYLKPNQVVELVLDGNPLETITAKVARIRPTAEIRSGMNVLIAECDLDNGQELLRPGMRGEASVLAHHSPLGWILFHRAVEKVYQLLR